MQILLWHFFLIKKSNKNNYTVHDNTFDSHSTYMISKNCPVFPKTLTEETAPNIWVSNYEKSDGVNPISIHIHTPYVIYTIVQSIQK